MDGMNEEQLSAYVDGELSGLDLTQVEAWLRDHPEDQALVEAWREDREALATLFGPVLQEPLPDALRDAVWRRRATPRWAMAAAAAGLLLTGALGGGAGVWQWQQQQWSQQLAQQNSQWAAGTAQGWVQRASYAHKVYVAEPRHAVEVKAQEEHLSRWLTRRIDIPVKLFDLHAQGYELVGGRLLPDGPGKSAQLMYQATNPEPAKDGTQPTPPRRVTVYLRKPEAGTDAAFRYEQHGPVGMFYWVEAGAGYALVGELPRETLLALAQAIYSQLTPGPATAPGTAPVPAAPTSKGAKPG